ncbi:MAG: kelch repeat-containing protein [Gemmatimonadales bacterium]
MKGFRRGLLVLAGIGVVLLLGSAGGFVVGRRWPLARLERLRVKLFGKPPEGWSVAARTDLDRYEVMRLLHGSSLFLFSGFVTDDQKVTSRVEALDLLNGVWSRKRDMPQTLTHASPVVIRDTAWFVGGFEGNHPGPATTRVWRYAINDDAWSNGPPLPAARGGGALVAVGDTLHYFGGWLPDRNTDSPDHWTLVIGDSAWHASAPLPLPRGHLAGGLLSGSIYAIGGVLGHDPVPIDVAAVHRFDLVTQQWDTAASLPFPMSHSEPATVLYDGRLIVAGGRSRGGGRENLDDILAYDPALGRWLHVGRMPKPFLGGIAATIGDTFYAGLGASRGADPDNPLIWRTTLRNRWRKGDSLLAPMGEVAGGIIDGRLYLVGEGERSTAVYDIAAGRWRPDAAEERPAAGNHHAAEVVNGKLYLLGGLGRDAEGRVQIYDPVSNRWSLGPPMPFAAGSSSSALIDGRLYVAGGIVGHATTASAAVLDIASGTWSTIKSMPRPRNHAASGTDGKRFFVFGGRGPGSGDSNVVANGFNDVQIYDPESGTWSVSDGSPEAPQPLPQARGGTGKAAWLDGEFWIMGGETLSGAGATKQGTYARVDIYDPARNQWRVGAALPTPRHGIFPLSYGGMIFVAGGGTMAAGSESNVLEILWPRKAVAPR